MNEDCRVEFGDRLIQTFREAQDADGDTDSLEDKWRRVEQDHKDKSEEAVILYAALCQTAGFRPREPDACWTHFEKIAKAGDTLVGTRADVALRRIAINWGTRYIDKYSLHHCKCTLLLSLRTVARKCGFERAVQWFNLLLLRKEGRWPTVREEMANSTTSWPVTGTCLTPENIQELSKHCKDGKFDADLQRPIDFAVSQTERRNLTRDGNGLLKPNNSNALPIEDEHMSMEQYMSHLRVSLAEPCHDVLTNATAVPSNNSAHNSAHEGNGASRYTSSPRSSDGCNDAVTPCRHTEALSIEIKDACDKISNDINDTLNRRFDDLSHTSEIRQARYESAVQIHIDGRIQRSSQEHLGWLKELYNKLESDSNASETRILQQIDGLPSIHTISTQITELFSQVADGLTLIVANTLVEHRSALLSQQSQVQKTVSQDTKLALQAIFQGLMWQRDVQLRFAVILSKTADITSESHLEAQTQQIALAEALKDRDERLSSMLQLLSSQHDGTKETSAFGHTPCDWPNSRYTSDTRSENNNVATAKGGREGVRLNDLHSTSTSRTGRMATVESESDNRDHDDCSARTSETKSRKSEVAPRGPRDRQTKAARIMEHPQTHTEEQEGARGSQDVRLGPVHAEHVGPSSAEPHAARESCANEHSSTQRVGAQEPESQVIPYEQSARMQSNTGATETQATEPYVDGPPAGPTHPIYQEGVPSDDGTNVSADMMSIDDDGDGVDAKSDLIGKVEVQKKRQKRPNPRRKNRTKDTQRHKPTGLEKTARLKREKERPIKVPNQVNGDDMEVMLSNAPTQESPSPMDLDKDPQQSDSMDTPLHERRSNTSQGNISDGDATSYPLEMEQDAGHNANEGSSSVHKGVPSFPAPDTDRDGRSPSTQPSDPSSVHIEYSGVNQVLITEVDNDSMPSEDGQAYLRGVAMASVAADLTDKDDKGLRASIEVDPTQESFVKSSLQAAGTSLAESPTIDPATLEDKTENIARTNTRHRGPEADLEPSRHTATPAKKIEALDESLLEAREIEGLAGVSPGPWSPQDLDNRIQSKLSDIAKSQESAETRDRLRNSKRVHGTYGTSEHGHTADKDDQEQIISLGQDVNADRSTPQSPIAAPLRQVEANEYTSKQDPGDGNRNEIIEEDYDPNSQTVPMASIS